MYKGCISPSASNDDCTTDGVTHYLTDIITFKIISRLSPCRAFTVCSELGCFSLYSLLSMTSLGAKGKTAQEMEKTLEDTAIDALVQDLYEELIKEVWFISLIIYIINVIA